MQLNLVDKSSIEKEVNNNNNMMMIITNNSKLVHPIKFCEQTHSKRTN